MVRACRSWTYTSGSQFVSPGVSVYIADVKARNRPLGETSGSVLAPGWWTSSAGVTSVTATVSPVWRSCTKMSATPLTSLVTRLAAKDAKATIRPSPDSAGSPLAPSPGVPPVATLARATWSGADRSTTYTCAPVPAGPATRLAASDANATTLPSSEMAGSRAGASAASGLTGRIVPAARSHTNTRSRPSAGAPASAAMDSKTTRPPSAETAGA